MRTLSDDSINILIIAAEASSSLYALRLLEHWKAQGIRYHAYGIGSREMESLGFECLGRSEELAVVGLQEVLAHRNEILTAFRKVVEAAEQRRPQIVLLLDYPYFNFRLAKKLHRTPGRSFEIVYYISPQIWAWRQGRVKLVKKYIDRMLVLFPFEPAFYKRHGIQVDFVGHPLLDELKRGRKSPSELLALKGKFGLGPERTVLGLMPGSRHSEIKHHLQTQLETAERLVSEIPSLSVVLLAAPGMPTDYLQSQLPSNLNFSIQMIQSDPFDMVAMCDAILVASGTATLVVGLMQRPMVIMYRMNSFTVWLAKWIMKRPRFFGMANLILDKEVAPEFFQDEANPAQLSQALRPFLKSLEARAAKAQELAEIQVKLGNSGATERVSEILMKMIKSPKAGVRDGQPAGSAL